MEALNSFMTEASVMKELKDTLWLIRSVFTEYWKQICSTFLHTTFTMLRKGVGILKTQPAIACSKLKMKALEQGVKYVQS